ncbi:hypothetical protein MINS_18940 [Mycolicibacterium insubricum]|nr:hypothetical protein [Mycolicibacterium insubricum]BBZ66465.1 hypothetical protein MINS_18940 [Mycolicibacterium insubricum]
MPDNTEKARKVGYPLATYRYVRLILVAVVAALFASVTLTAKAAQWCWQPSISAFYYTHAHAVFIGALCATGVCLIAYKGMNRTEDILLNFSGFLALVVALVPTTPPAGGAACGEWLPTVGEPWAAVDNNIGAVLIGAALGLLVFAAVRAAAVPPPQSAAELAASDDTEPDALARIIEFVLRWAQLVVPVAVAATLVVGVVWFFADRASFATDAHGAAAIAMFAGIIAVVVLYACYSAQHSCHCHTRGWFAVFYAVIAAVMTVTLALTGWVHYHHPQWEHWLLWLEVLLITEFALFWAVQTADSWNGPYDAPMPALVGHRD